MADGKALLYISLIVILAVVGKSVVCGQQVIAFQANYLSNSQLQPGNTLVFSTIKLNIGGGYSSTSGIFTAPQNGNYSFNAPSTPLLMLGVTPVADVLLYQPLYLYNRTIKSIFDGKYTRTRVARSSARVYQ